MIKLSILLSSINDSSYNKNMKLIIYIKVNLYLIMSDVMQSDNIRIMAFKYQTNLFIYFVNLNLTSNLTILLRKYCSVYPYGIKLKDSQIFY